MNNIGTTGAGKSAGIVDAAAKVAEQLASPLAQARLASAAAACRNRVTAIVQGAIVDREFLAKRVTI